MYGILSLSESAKVKTLWQFACERYSIQPYQALLLEAQNTYGVSICAILWAQWLDALQINIPLDRFEHGLKLCDQIQASILVPIRRARSFDVVSVDSDFPYDAIKKGILGLELDIEKQLLNTLEVTTLTYRMTPDAKLKHEYVGVLLSSQPDIIKKKLKQHIGLVGD